MNRFSQSIMLGVVVGVVGASSATGNAQLSPVPTPAPGVTHVSGEVTVTNRPTVLARQDGTWTVTCVPEPPAPGRSAVIAGEQVALTYVDGTRETVRVGAVLADGWITTARRRINLANVIAMDPQ